MQILLRAIVRWFEEKSRSSIENALKYRLFEKILRKDYASVTAVHSGEWLNRLTSDTVVCANGIVEILPNIVGMLVKMFSALIMILTLELKLSITLDTLTARILKLSSDSQSRIEPVPFYSWWNTTDRRADSAVAPVAHEISPDHRF